MVIFGQTCRYLDSDRIDLATFVFLAVSWSIWALYTDIKVQQFLIKSSLNNVKTMFFRYRHLAPWKWVHWWDSVPLFVLWMYLCAGILHKSGLFDGCLDSLSAPTDAFLSTPDFIPWVHPHRLRIYSPTLTNSVWQTKCKQCGAIGKHYRDVWNVRNQGMSQDLSAGNIKDVKSTEKKT